MPIIDLTDSAEEEEAFLYCGCSVMCTNSWSTALYFRPVCDECNLCTNCCERRQCYDCDEYSHSIHTYRGEEYCETCYDARTIEDTDGIGNYGNNIRDYGCDVLDALEPDVDLSIRNYGIELEFEVNPKKMSAESFAGLIVNHSKLKDKWICKHDGSLSMNGVEVVSIPMPYQELHDSLGELWDSINIPEFCLNHPKNKKCGTHIHASRNGVSSRAIGREWALWARGYYSNEMKELLRAFAGRYSCDYAQWTCSAPIELFRSDIDTQTGKAHDRSNGWPYRARGKRLGAYRFNDHYAATSCSGRHQTFEKRVFCGATRASTAQRFLECYDMFLNIAEETHGIDIITKMPAFLVEVGKRIEHYPALKEAFNDPRKRLGGSMGIRYASYFENKKAKKELTDPAQLAKRAERNKRNERNGRDVPCEPISRSNPKPTKTNIKMGLQHLEKFTIKIPKPAHAEEPASVELLPAQEFPQREFLSFIGYMLDERQVRQRAADRTGFMCNTTNCLPCAATLEEERDFIFQETWIDYMNNIESQFPSRYPTAWNQHPLTRDHFLYTRSFCACWAIRGEAFRNYVDNVNYLNQTNSIAFTFPFPEYTSPEDTVHV